MLLLFLFIFINYSTRILQDDVMAELIAEEDEKAAELSNGIEFVEEESQRCDRSRDCRSGEFCDRGRCQRNNNYCHKQSDCQ